MLKFLYFISFLEAGPLWYWQTGNYPPCKSHLLLLAICLNSDLICKFQNITERSSNLGSSLTCRGRLASSDFESGMGAMTPADAAWTLKISLNAIKLPCRTSQTVTNIIRLKVRWNVEKNFGLLKPHLPSNTHCKWIYNHKSISAGYRTIMRKAI